MTILYVATDANRLKVIEIDDETGKFVRLIQEIDPIVNTADIADASTGGANNNNNIDYDDDGSSASSWSSYLGGIIAGTGTTHSTPTTTTTTTTEWIERHHMFPLLYVFTSFFNRAISIVTTYRIIGGGINDDVNSDKIMKGRLKKLGEIQTGGMHVSHVTFSPNNTTMCVGHYIDGSISFFDCSQDGAALQDPVRIVVLPEVRPETRNTTFPNCLPSIHHVTYNPYPNNNDDKKEEEDGLFCRYLLVSDTSKQGRVWTYAVNSLGIPISDKPISFRKVTLITPPPGWLSQIVNWSVGLANYRIRRCVVHPNGFFVYFLLEFNAVIQVYEINPYTGKISGDCLQEIPTIDSEYFGGYNKYNNNSSSSSKFTGISIHAPAELFSTTNELFVSNRGFNYGGPGSRFSFGQAESGVRIFTIEDNGMKLVPKQNLNCYGPVRHFFHNNNNNFVNKLYVGSDKTAGGSSGSSSGNNNNDNSNSNSASIETFVRRQPEALGGEFERVGSLAHVGMDTITCIALLE
ncbi:MAG: 6-phosphogluconolactonase (cycloisomerase 2 family) [Bacillariaceae sp.]|jgi:6-phosphogluconolactonase (cycloisomerase 2 family)